MTTITKELQNVRTAIAALRRVEASMMQPAHPPRTGEITENEVLRQYHSERYQWHGEHEKSLEVTIMYQSTKSAESDPKGNLPKSTTQRFAFHEPALALEAITREVQQLQDDNNLILDVDLHTTTSSSIAMVEREPVSDDADPDDGE